MERTPRPIERVYLPVACPPGERCQRSLGLRTAWGLGLFCFSLGYLACYVVLAIWG